MATKRLGDLVDEYLGWRRARGRKPSTLATDRRVLYRFVREVGDKQISSLTERHVEAWFFSSKGLRGAKHKNARISGPVCEQTFNNYRSTLLGFLTWCQRQGYIRRNLLADIDPLPVQPRQHQRPTPTVLLALLDSADNPRDRAWLATGLNTALRSGEMKPLTIADLDLGAGHIAVVIGKTRQVDLQPISSDLDVELRRWLVRYEADLGRPLRNRDLLFPARRAGTIRAWVDGVALRDVNTWKPECQISRTEGIVQHALAALGLPTYFEGTHTLRRAVALAYFEEASREQGDISAMQETMALLHHSTMATTERYLGRQAPVVKRDRRMKGKPFLSAMVTAENVTPLRRDVGH